MDKDALLKELAAKVETGEISRDEVMRRLKITLAKRTATHEDNAGSFTHFSVSKMLYLLGAVIVVIGIIFFISQIWDNIGSVGRITVTLGLGLVLTAMGSMLLVQKPNERIGMVFQFIGGMLIPGGALVTLSEMNVESTTLWPVTITFGTIFVFYMLLNIVHKNAVLTFFAIGNGTAFVYLVVEAIVDGPSYMHDDLYAYLTMAVGLSYLLLAHTFRTGWNSVLIGVLYFLGITGFLGGAFSRVFDSPPWQMLYFLLVIAGFTLAVYTKSRSILAMSTIFLIAHVSYITSEYFADSIGWPISLVLLGFVFIGLGYASISINRKYIAEATA